jgi:hypothetical protein
MSPNHFGSSVAILAQAFEVLRCSFGRPALEDGGGGAIGGRFGGC